MSDWIKDTKLRIGTVVGDASTDTFTFILKSFSAKLGDIVATPTEVPGSEGTYGAVVWGRVVGINRVNPFFPAEAAQELSEQDINLLDTVLSTTRDYLQAEVLILGATRTADAKKLRLSPVTYPVKPSAGVFSPPAHVIQVLLTGEADDKTVKLRLGSLIGRKDVEVSLEANKIVSRHLAILAMTGGGKTVAARRVLRELIGKKYPVVILDPHGDYLAFYEKRKELGGVDVKLFYPAIRVYNSDTGAIEELIAKMGHRLTDPQKDFFQTVVGLTSFEAGATAERYIASLITTCDSLKKNGRNGDKINAMTANAVRRSLDFVRRALATMQANNDRLREQDRLKSYKFQELPDPQTSPDEIVRPGQVAILYLAGFDHLTQSAIASIVLEHLFAHRAKLTDRIAPFLTVIEEAHNFVPGRREGTEDTPSLATVRKVITEGRKFGTGLMLISQRPSRLDETILSQCNSFLVLRLVNPKDKTFVRSVMENLSESDANILQTFGPGQGIVSGQAVRFPLLVDIDFDEDLVSDAIGDEDFVGKATRWQPDPVREAIAGLVDGLPEETPRKSAGSPSASRRRKPLPEVGFNAGKRRGAKPSGAGKRPRA